jgi:hypothetical protein
VEAQVEAADEGGRKGGTRFAPIEHNIPRAWQPQQGTQKQGTVLLSRQDLEKVKPAETDTLEKEAKEPRLLMLSSPEPGRPFPLISDGEVNFWNIGRDPARDLSIVIRDPSVSDLHAKLVRRGARWKIIDQMATNGVYVNGEKYNAAFLKSKDYLRLGNVELLFLVPHGWTPDGPARREGWLARLRAWLR